jgi:hypothetical protein
LDEKWTKMSYLKRDVFGETSIQRSGMKNKRNKIKKIKKKKEKEIRNKLYMKRKRT